MSQILWNCIFSERKLCLYHVKIYNKECDLSRIKTVVPNRRMDRAARLLVNQGEAEGVYDCTRPMMSPKICR